MADIRMVRTIHVEDKDITAYLLLRAMKTPSLGEAIPVAAEWEAELSRQGYWCEGGPLIRTCYGPQGEVVDIAIATESYAEIDEIRYISEKIHSARRKLGLEEEGNKDEEG